MSAALASLVTANATGAVRARRERGDAGVGPKQKTTYKVSPAPEVIEQ